MNSLLRISLWAITTLAIVACDSSVTGPSGSPSTSSSGVGITGSFQGGSSGLRAQRAFGAADATGITVTVAEDPAISTTVDAGGFFSLRGLPQGAFTLQFFNGGALLNELTFEAILPNMEIDIQVELTPSGQVRLLSERRTGIGHQDFEIQGRISEIVPGTHPNEGTLVVNGITIEARPGQTTIREGNRERSMDDLRVGNQVHVKAVGEGDVALAYEIKLQEDDSIDDPPVASSCPAGPNGKVTLCHKPDKNGGNTLTVGASAWPAHEAHGDTCGPCSQ